MKKILSAAVAFAAAVGMLSLGAISANAEVTGTGTESDPYIVSTADDWADANKAGYVKLENDIEIKSTFKPADGMILDLNGYSITSDIATMCEIISGRTFILRNSDTAKESQFSTTGNRYAIKAGAENSNVTIENVKISCSAQAVMSSKTGSKLVIKNSEITGGTCGINFSNGELSIQNADVSATNRSQGAAIMLNGGTATLNGGEYTGVNSTLNLKGASEVTIDGGTFYNNTVGKAVIGIDGGFAGTLNINNGTFTADGQKVYAIGDWNNGSGSAKINIRGGTFNGNYSKRDSNSATEITITGGTFAFDPSAYVDTKVYAVTENNSMWTVTEKTAESKPVKVTLTPVGDTVRVDNGFGKAFTFEVNLTEKQISDIVLKYGDQEASVVEKAPVVEGAAKIGIIVTADTEGNVDAFDSGKVTISF